MADIKKKQLVFNIIEFLKTSTEDGTVKEDDKESMEVAIQCLAESFGVDPESAEEKSRYSLAPASLVSLLDVYLKTKAKSSPAPAATTSSFSTSAPSSSASAPSPAESAEARAKADALKTEGNSLMSQKLYDSAIEKYTEALKLVKDPVYYSNRAAAWGGAGEHDKAVEDAESAIELNPKFVKAYSRLGHAHFSNGDYSASIEAYEKGLELEPGNANMKSSLTTAKARLAESSSNSVADREPSAGGSGGGGGMPDLSALAGLMGGAGAGGRGGAGGMPDLASMMNNPQMMQMAQQMMANGGLERLMSNPSIRQMAENMQSGGGMPDFNQLASDPAMRDLASQFMGGEGRGGE